jgi:hypothetical protein
MLESFWKKINLGPRVKKTSRILTRDQLFAISREFQIREIIRRNEAINENANFNSKIWKNRI